MRRSVLLGLCGVVLPRALSHALYSPLFRQGERSVAEPAFLTSLTVPAVTAVVDPTRARIVTGQTDPVPLGQLSFPLRERVRSDVFEDGLSRVPAEMRRLREEAGGP